MSLRVRCLLCLQVLTCDRNNTATLLEHCKDKHPNIKIIRLSDELSNSDIAKQLTKQDLSPTNAPTSVIIPSPANNFPENRFPTPVFVPDNFRECKCPSITNSNNRAAKPKIAFSKFLASASRSCIRPSDQLIYERRTMPIDPIIPTKRQKLYKTSIEKWRPGSARITCPQCGVTKVPTVRQHSNRMSRSSVGAACMLTFWPFCFMPFLFPAPLQEKLHCSECGHYFGRYDHKTDKVIPSDEYIVNEHIPSVEPIRNNNSLENSLSKKLEQKDNNDSGSTEAKTND